MERKLRTGIDSHEFVLYEGGHTNVTEIGISILYKFSQRVPRQDESIKSQFNWVDRMEHVTFEGRH